METTLTPHPHPHTHTHTHKHTHLLSICLYGFMSVCQQKNKWFPQPLQKKHIIPPQSFTYDLGQYRGQVVRPCHAQFSAVGSDTWTVLIGRMTTHLFAQNTLIIQKNHPTVQDKGSGTWTAEARSSKAAAFGTTACERRRRGEGGERGIDREQVERSKREKKR
jgi:hypothetical protein